MVNIFGVTHVHTRLYYSLVLFLLTITISGCIGLEYPANNTTNQTPPVAVLTPTPEFAVREPSTVYVKIRGSAFDPLELNVVNGTTVTWMNEDSGQHVIRVDNVSSPLLNKRESWSYKFNERGTFEYSCSVHSWMKHGRIFVE